MKFHSGALWILALAIVDHLTPTASLAIQPLCHAATSTSRLFSSYLDGLGRGSFNYDSSPRQQQAPAAPEVRMEAPAPRITQLDLDMAEEAGPIMPAPQGRINQGLAEAEEQRRNVDYWERSGHIVQGTTLKTWSFVEPSIERVQVFMKTEGRPLMADLELWQGPDNTPFRMNLYSENGLMRPLSTLIDTPGHNNAIAIRNTATMEYPLTASVEADLNNRPIQIRDDLAFLQQSLIETQIPLRVQGGAVLTRPFGSAVDSILIMLITEGRPLNARIELLQGPNNNKQVMDVYTEDGVDRPFFMLVQTPGPASVVRLVNTGVLEFPLAAYVEPYEIRDELEGLTTYDDFFVIV